MFSAGRHTQEREEGGTIELQLPHLPLALFTLPPAPSVRGQGYLGPRKEHEERKVDTPLTSPTCALSLGDSKSVCSFFYSIIY